MPMQGLELVVTKLLEDALEFDAMLLDEVAEARASS